MPEADWLEGEVRNSHPPEVCFIGRCDWCLPTRIPQRIQIRQDRSHQEALRRQLLRWYHPYGVQI